MAVRKLGADVPNGESIEVSEREVAADDEQGAQPQTRTRDGEDGFDYLGAFVCAQRTIEEISRDAKYDESEQPTKPLISHPLCRMIPREREDPAMCLGRDMAVLCTTDVCEILSHVFTNELVI
jgi:hypothetical protein